MSVTVIPHDSNVEQGNIFCFLQTLGQKLLHPAALVDEPHGKVGGSVVMGIIEVYFVISPAKASQIKSLWFFVPSDKRWRSRLRFEYFS